MISLLRGVSLLFDVILFVILPVFVFYSICLPIFACLFIPSSADGEADPQLQFLKPILPQRLVQYNCRGIG